MKVSEEGLNSHDRSKILRSPAGRLPLRPLAVATLLTVAPFSAFLYGAREYVGFRDIWRYPVVATIFVVTLGVCASAVLGKTWGARIGMALGWFVFALFWYRDISSVGDRYLSFLGIPAELLWGLVLVVGLALVYQVESKPALLKAALLFSLTMALLPLGQYGIAKVADGTDPGAAFEISSVDEWASRPDIYYLIVDGLGRADVLKEIYDIDISGFTETLTGDGFVVADRALSSHPMTWLSVPAVFDQEYQAHPGPRGRPETHSQTNRIMAGDSRTHAELAGQGYRFVIATEDQSRLCKLDFSPIQDLATCLVKGDSLSAAIRERLGWLTPLHGLANRGLLPGALRRWLAAEDLRWADGEQGGGTFMTDDVLSTVNSVKEDHSQAPVFVVAHMMYPHPPYTLDSECGPSSHDTFSPSIDAWDDIVGLQMGVDCTKQQVLQLIESVDREAIIVVQSDHGPGYGSLLDGSGTSLEETPIKDLWVRASVFSAVRLPEECRSLVPDTYAGVNTFRVIFTCLSNVPRALKPQSSFWAWYDNRLVVDVTARLRQYGDSLQSE